MFEAMKRAIQLLLFDINELPEGPPKPKASIPRRKRSKLSDAYRFLFDANGEAVQPPPAAPGGKKKRKYKPIASRLYEMKAGDVDEQFGDDHPEVMAIQEMIRVRSLEVQATWTPEHEKKARNYKLGDMVLTPTSMGSMQ